MDITHTFGPLASEAAPPVLAPASKPVQTSETFGPFTLVCEAWNGRFSYPDEDGLPMKQYTHVEASLKDANGQAVIPSEASVELKGFDVYFEGSWTGPFLAVSLVDDFRAALARSFPAAP